MKIFKLSDVNVLEYETGIAFSDKNDLEDITYEQLKLIGRSKTYEISGIAEDLEDFYFKNVKEIIFENGGLLIIDSYDHELEYLVSFVAIKNFYLHKLLGGEL